MDGRLNLNAHGNQMQYLAAAANNPIITSGPSNTSVGARGLGFGPAWNKSGKHPAQCCPISSALAGSPNQINGRYGANTTVGALNRSIFYYIFNDYLISYLINNFPIPNHHRYSR